MLQESKMYTLDITAEVQAALEDNKPIVALESTIITHGMPWPQNYDMANRVEDMVRAHGATPATIAVIEGRIKIGLDQDALKTLAQTQGARKLSRADLAVCLVDGATGATTVAATMILAHLAGIYVFATGGIGGVHRGQHQSKSAGPGATAVAADRAHSGGGGRWSQRCPPASAGPGGDPSFAGQCWPGAAVDRCGWD